MRDLATTDADDSIFVLSLRSNRLNRDMVVYAATVSSAVGTSSTAPTAGPCGAVDSRTASTTPHAP